MSFNFCQIDPTMAIKVCLNCDKFTDLFLMLTVLERCQMNHLKPDLGKAALM